MKSYDNQIRKYKKEECITFRKTSERFGGLSNMAPGFSITIGQAHFLTAEALYQCCRFPNYPDVQQKIMCQSSPIVAKRISRENIHLTRNDWDMERIKIMRWCLCAKLICNWHDFGELLDSTEEKLIVEDSPKDIFWGASWDGSYYVGVNALGRLLMQVRDLYRKTKKQELISLSPLEIPDFLMLGKQIERIYIDTTQQPYPMKMW